MKTMVEIAHSFLSPALHRQAVCVDATFGQGKDTDWFVKRKVGKVYAFDIQEHLIERRKDDFQSHVRLIADSHASMGRYVKEDVDAMIFNFGFCPHEDPSVTTMPSESVKAIGAGLKRLRIKGRMALVIYPHQFGKQESEAIEAFLKPVDPHIVSIQKVCGLNIHTGPYAILLEKRKEWK